MSEPTAATLPRGGLRALGAFTACTLIWSSTFLFISIGNGSMPPLWAAGLRLTLASVLLGALTLARGDAWPRGRALEAALGFGIVDFGISVPLLYWGERVIPSSIAAILFATIPICTALFARAFGLESLSLLKLLGGITGLAGVALLFSSELGAAMPPGPLLAVFLGAVTAALAGVLLKRSPGGSPIAIIAIAHAAGAPLCLAASFVVREPHHLPPTPGAWLSLLYLTGVGSILAFVLFTWLVQRWSVTATSFIAILTPVLATLLGAVVLHEHLGRNTLVGAAIVLGGVGLAIAGDQVATRR